MRKIEKRNPERIAQLGEKLFNTKDAGATIEGLETFFSKLGSPVKLSEIGKGEKDLKDILRIMDHNRVTGMNFKLNAEDRKEILMLMV